MSKMLRVFISVQICFFAWAVGSLLNAQSGIYDRVGIVPGHGTFGSLPEENIDLFTGNVTLRYRDVYLPGPNGLDVEVWRVYNSKILKDRQSGDPVVQAYPQSWVGLGWTLHMGMLHGGSSATPVIEFPDGRLETAFSNAYGLGANIYLTRDFLKYDKTFDPPNHRYPSLHFKNGVVWTFAATALIHRADGTDEFVGLVTNIIDGYNHYITITYDPDPNIPLGFLPSIQTITDSTGRVVTFETTGTPKRLVRIRVKDASGNDRVFNYSVGTYDNGYFRLDSFTPPMLPATMFEYLNGSSSRYELSRLTTSYGGVLEYSYENHTFNFNGISLDSRVVVGKHIVFKPGDEATWSYAYPSYQGSATGTVTVDGPVYDSSVTYNAYTASTPWKIGLIAGRQAADGSFSETYDWTFQQISATNWMVLGTNMGAAKGPLLSTVVGSRIGDASSKMESLYERTEPKRYGLPTKTNIYLGTSGPLKSSSYLTYWFEAHSGFKDRHMMDFLSQEQVLSSQSQLVKKTETTYYEETGKWGALKQVKRWKEGSTYYIWDYEYTCTDPATVTVKVDPPGPAEKETIAYSHGVKYNDAMPDFTRLTRVINSYDSSVTSEKRQDEGIATYAYDNLGRVMDIELMGSYNDSHYEWRPNGENKVRITRGDQGHENIVTKYWDGFGRDLGSTETGEDVTVTLYSLRTLDGEGRVVKDFKASLRGGPDDPGYTYLYNAADQVTRITDPLGKQTSITYSGTTKTVTDPENHATVYTYSDLPGLPTQVTDALGRAAVYGYDASGRLTGVVFNGTRTHSYSYDGVDNVLSESHPETGPISYAYNASNLLSSKTWSGATLTFSYDTSNRLYHTTATTGGVVDIVDYAYNFVTGRVQSIVDLTTGWRRDDIVYGPFGNLTSERLTIPGLPAKTLTYSYDMNLNPTGWKEAANPYAGEVVGNNSLNMPLTVTFNPNGTAYTVVSAAAYGPNKAPASITFGNTTAYSSTYNDAGMPGLLALTRGGTTLYDANYAYDGARNILGITSTAPALTASFGYDALNRLTSATYSSGTVTSYGYAYDEYGNMLTARQNGGIVYQKSYLASNRISGFNYDNRGNFLSSGVGNICYWDAQNRLQYIQSSAGTVIGKYLYDDRGLRLSALPPLPEIDIKHDEVAIPSGGEAYLTAPVGQSFDETLTIRNLGDANLSLGSVTITGDDEDNFDVFQPSSPILPGGSTSLIIRFHPRSAGHKVALLHIPSNDVDEASYEINLYGNYQPEIEILQAPDGGDWDYGEIEIGDYWDQTFTIRNLGEKDLLLYGDPIVLLEGPDTDSFEVITQPNTPFETPPVTIAPGGTRTFVVRFSANSEGLKTVSFSIVNNDWNENPYDITLTGTGVIGGNKVDEETAFVVTSPAVGEELVPGAFQLVTWRGAQEVKEVQIEYSTDNGSTFRPIVERTKNTGSYEWLVPPVLSGLCLVRVSDADGVAAQGETLSLEFKLKISSAGSETEAFPPALMIRAVLPDLKTTSSWTADLTFATDPAQNAQTLGMNSVKADLGDFGAFFDRWHTVGLLFRPLTLTGTLFLDGKPLLDGIPLVQGAWAGASPEIVVTSAGDAAVRIEDFEARYKDLALRPKTAGDEVSQALSKDSFEGYPAGTFPGQGGWRAPGAQATYPSGSSNQDNAGNLSVKGLSKEKRRAGRVAKTFLSRPAGETSQAALEGGKAAVDEADSVTGLQSLLIETDGTTEILVAKRLSLPARVPFGVSEGNFAIGAAQLATQAKVVSRSRLVDERRRARLGKDEKEYNAATDRPRETARENSPSARAAGGSSSGSGSATTKLMSAAPVGNFYIYSFDGKLLQLYDVYGVLLKDYIYMGDRLIAEYDHVGSRLLYYTPDQINTTRVVTDGVGNVVYSAAHDPYGGIQQTWVSTYDPQLKFSGKERDAESQLDYFGARYYDRSQYRFISVDVVRNASLPLFDAQYTNFYSFFRDNPISYLDINGAFPVRIVVTRTVMTASGITGTLTMETPFGTNSYRTTELPYLGKTLAETAWSGSAIRAGTYDGVLERGANISGHIVDAIRLENKNLLGTRTGIYIHSGTISNGCILVDYMFTSGLPYNARQDIINTIDLADSALATCSSVLQVLEGFAGLLSVNDFPEITVTVQWTPALLGSLILRALIGFHF
jgi:RHS repeat-associated protein